MAGRLLKDIDARSPLQQRALILTTRTFGWGREPKDEFRESSGGIRGDALPSNEGRQAAR